MDGKGREGAKRIRVAPGRSRSEPHRQGKALFAHCGGSVSYTHLDVYKRQDQYGKDVWTIDGEIYAIPYGAWSITLLAMILPCLSRSIPWITVTEPWWRNRASAKKTAERPRWKSAVPRERFLLRTLGTCILWIP